MKRSILFSALGLATVAGFSLIAGTAFAKLARTGTPAAGFHANGPAGFAIDGTTADTKVDDDGTTVTFTVTLKTLVTGIALRDNHLHECLEVEKFPEATLVVKRADLKFPEAGKTSKEDVKGTFSIHGKSKEVTVHYKVESAKDGLHGDGSLKINTNDYGIVIPSYLGITVKPDVDVSLKFQANDA